MGIQKGAAFPLLIFVIKIGFAGNLQIWTNQAAFCVTESYIVNGNPVTALSCMTTAPGTDAPNCTKAGAGKQAASGKQAAAATAAAAAAKAVLAAGRAGLKRWFE